jgi:hypothetical protein
MELAEMMSSLEARDPEVYRRRAAAAEQIARRPHASIGLYACILAVSKVFRIVCRAGACMVTMLGLMLVAVQLQFLRHPPQPLAEVMDEHTVPVGRALCPNCSMDR